MIVGFFRSALVPLASIAVMIGLAAGAVPIPEFIAAVLPFLLLIAFWLALSRQARSLPAPATQRVGRVRKVLQWIWVPLIVVAVVAATASAGVGFLEALAPFALIMGFWFSVIARRKRSSGPRADDARSVPSFAKRIGLGN